MKRFYITQDKWLNIEYCDDWDQRCPAYFPYGRNVKGHKEGSCSIEHKRIVEKYGRQEIPEWCPLEDVQ